MNDKQTFVFDYTGYDGEEVVTINPSFVWMKPPKEGPTMLAEQVALRMAKLIQTIIGYYVDPQMQGECYRMLDNELLNIK